MNRCQATGARNIRLDSLLKEYGILGISDIDTRMLTRILRHHGTMKGILTTGNRARRRAEGTSGRYDR